MNTAKQISQNKDFCTLKLAVGCKSSSSYNYITKTLNNNKTGHILDDITDVPLGSILIAIANGTFRDRALADAAKSSNKTPKHCARSIFSFHTYRYRQDDRDEEGHLVRHNASFIHNIGFQGFDFDPEKDAYDDEQRLEIGNVLKQILYDELHYKRWFICSTLSTGGNGTHCYTWSKVNEYIEDEDRIRWYYTNYDMKLRYMCKCLYELKKRLPWVDISKITIDDAMRRPGQTINITVVDTEPLINYDFRYEYDDEVVEQFNYGKTTYKDISDDSSLMMSEEDSFIYELYKSYIKKIKNDDTKYDEVKKNFNEEIEIRSREFDLSKCTPYYWRHSANQDKGWTGNQVIHTLLWFFDKDTVKAIWSHPNFYTEDPKDWIRFVDSWEFDDSHMPNFKLIKFLNERCGFNLQYKHIIKAKPLEEKYDHVIHLEDDEYIGSKADEVFGCIKTGINILIAGVGTGKTSLWIERDKNMKEDMLNISMMKSTIITEPYNAILNTKFGDGGYECPIYKGSRHLSWNTLDKGLSAANYKKLVELGNKQNIYWDSIDYIVCDESHLLTKEYFRSGDLIRMIEFINEAAKHIPVVLMTGTPSDELEIFKDVNTIYIDKPDRREIYYRWLRFTPDKNVIGKWDVLALKSFIEALVKNEHRKVYVYDGNGSLRSFKKLMRVMPDIRCCIYHKRHIDDVMSSSEDMTYIDTYHELGDKYDVLLSSCYFGVGNDLNDECDTACIIVGNHTWQEDVQVVGRWRNSKNIKTYCVLTHQSEERNASKKMKDLMIKDAEKDIRKIFNDYINRENNITIGSCMIHIDNSKDIPLLALMKVHEAYNTPIEYKREKLGDNYFLVDDNQICPLRWVDTDIIDAQHIIKIMKDEDNIEKKNFLIQLIDGEELIWHNEDGKLLRWQKCAKYIFDHYRKLFDEIYVNGDYGKKFSKLNSLELFCRISRRYNAAPNADRIDWAEVKALHWYMTELGKVDLKEKNEEYLEKSGISYEEHISIVSYILMVNWTNKDAQTDKLVECDYYDKFNERCHWYNNMHDEMIRTLIGMKKEYEIGDIFGMDDITISEFKDMDDRIVEVHDKGKVKLIKMQMYKQIYRTLKYRRHIRKSKSGKTGGEKGNEVTVTDKMKENTLRKYNLKVGDKFSTQKALAKQIGVHEQTIKYWKKAGLIL